MTILVGALLLPACGSPPGPRHVLLVTFDTTRADRFGFSGYPLARTATVDRLAAEGVHAVDAVAAAPLTMPSHATIMTGLLPPAHGVRDNGAYVLPEEATTLAEALRGAGYETQAFVSAVVLARRYGLAQGFDGYDDDLWAEDAPRMFMIRDRPAERTVDRALAWYESWCGTAERRPFFVWLHLFDPHQPYRPSADLATLCPTPYDAEIAAADRALGRLVERLRGDGVLDDTLMVVTSDHGESLGEHGEKTHGVFVYDATMKVPLVLRAPGVLPSGSTYEGPVHGADLAPTILGLLRLPGGEAMHGADLSAALRGIEAAPSRPQYVESLLAELGFGMAPLHGLREGGFKLIRAPKPELYELSSDPGETHNLFGDRPEVAARLDRRLDEILSEAAAYRLEPESAALSGETEEMLQALGYLAPAEDRASVAGLDPKDGMELYARLEEARHLAQEERWAEAGDAAREILEVMPEHVSARNVLAVCLAREGRREEARAEYLRSLGSLPDQARVHAALAGLALRDGDLEEARSRARRALQSAPGFVEAMATLGMVAMLEGDHDAAERWYSASLGADPGFPLGLRRSGDLMYELGRWQEALDLYQRALERIPEDIQAIVQAGNCARRLGRDFEAERWFRRALDLRPDAWIPRYNLACLASVQGRVDDALELLEQAASSGLDDPGLVAADRDLEALHGLPRFEALANRG